MGAQKVTTQWDFLETAVGTTALDSQVDPNRTHPSRYHSLRSRFLVSAVMRYSHVLWMLNKIWTCLEDGVRRNEERYRQG